MRRAVVRHRSVHRASLPLEPNWLAQPRPAPSEKYPARARWELINDDSSVPWTMFNDNVQMGFFDVYDQYLVNILYDPRVRPGMRKGEVDSAKLVM